jgi:hypothetical protein
MSDWFGIKKIHLLRETPGTNSLFCPSQFCLIQAKFVSKIESAKARRVAQVYPE